MPKKTSSAVKKKKTVKKFSALPPISPTHHRLPSISTLIQETWQMYSAQAYRIYFLVLIPYFVAYFANNYVFRSKATLLFLYPSINLPLGISWLSHILFFVLAAITGLSVLHVYDQPTLRLREALRLSFQKLGPYIWTIALVMMIVMGGSLLFLVPSLIFLVWAASAQFITAFESERGLNAIVKSRFYVYNRFWPVAIRLLFVVLIQMACIFFLDWQQNPLIGELAYIALIPIFSGYSYRVYTHLRATADEKSISVEQRNKWRTIFQFLIGFGLVAVFVIYGMPVLFTQ